MRALPTIDPRWSAGVRDALLLHFDAHARSLPWRRTRDPYAIWISEVMLQQTRVDAVVPYYERWVQRFPDVAALADASLDDVLKAWAGLGYYSRARNLHSAARVLRERHDGAVPADYDALRALPGVGEYTAGAVSSIAYGARRPAIDGNVRRVVARLIDDPRPSSKVLRGVANALVPADRPGDLNQALMELGATICTPRSPRCDACPVADFCAARAAGTQLDRPRPRRVAAPPLFTLATAVVRAPDGGVLLTRRPATGLLARMWCCPARDVSDEAHAADAAIAITHSLLGDVAIVGRKHIGTVDHTFSHRRERYVCWRIDVTNVCALLPDNAVWATGQAAEFALPLPRAQQRILSLFADSCA